MLALSGAVRFIIVKSDDAATMRAMDYTLVETWIEEYIKAWRTRDTALLEHVFSDTFAYKTTPFQHAITDPAVLRQFWQETSDPSEEFTVAYDIVAIEGDIAVVELDVRYTAPRDEYYKDIWIIQLDDNGLCFAFEEWPIKAQQSTEKWY